MDFNDTDNASSTQEGGTTAKACPRCGITKSLSEFHKKGARIDGSCKTCISAKKKARYKKQRLQSKSAIAIRARSSVLVVDSLKIKEIDTGSGIDRSHFESILQEFVFDSVSRNGGRDEES